MHQRSIYLYFYVNKYSSKIKNEACRGKLAPPKSTNHIVTFIRQSI